MKISGALTITAVAGLQGKVKEDGKEVTGSGATVFDRQMSKTGAIMPGRGWSRSASIDPVDSLTGRRLPAVTLARALAITLVQLTRPRNE